MRLKESRAGDICYISGVCPDPKRSSGPGACVSYGAFHSFDNLFPFAIARFVHELVEPKGAGGTQASPKAQHESSRGQQGTAASQAQEKVLVRPWCGRAEAKCLLVPGLVTSG